MYGQIAYGTIRHMNFREAEPDAIRRMAASMTESLGPININPDTFSKPQRLILNAMKVLRLGGIALLIPDGKVLQKEPTDIKP